MLRIRRNQGKEDRQKVGIVFLQRVAGMVTNENVLVFSGYYKKIPQIGGPKQ